MPPTIIHRPPFSRPLDPNRNGRPTINDALLAAALRRRVGSAFENQLVLATDAIWPQPVVEHRPMRVRFTVRNGTAAPVKGVVIASLKMPTSSQDVPVGWDYAIGPLQPGHVESGVVSFFAPEAARKVTLTLRFLEYIEPTPPREQGTYEERWSDIVTFDVAARFTLDIDQIEITDTASYHQDTVGVNIVGTAGGGWQSLGNKNNGTYPVKLPPIGPVDLLEGDANTGIEMVVAIVNAGHSSDLDNGRRLFDMLSDWGRAIADYVTGGQYASASTAANAAHHELHAFLTEDCDTVVLYDWVRMSNQEAFNRTFGAPASTGWLEKKKKKGEILLDGVLGGGCRDSHYRARWVLNRKVKPTDVSFPLVFEGQGDGVTRPMHVPRGGKLRPAFQIAREATTAQYVWRYKVVDGRADSIDEHTGEYTAPKTLDVANYAVIQATALIDGQERYTGYAVVTFA